MDTSDNVKFRLNRKTGQNTCITPKMYSDRTTFDNIKTRKKSNLFIYKKFVRFALTLICPTDYNAG